MDTTSLPDVARTNVERARGAAHGRSAQTVHGGHDRVLRQTVIALRAGEALHEHRSSREATLQVLTGSVRLTAGAEVRDAAAGELVAVPVDGHVLTAIEDSAMLLTVGLVLGPREPVGTPTGARPTYSWQEDWE